MNELPSGRTFLGLMSGTSADGIDAALVRFDEGDAYAAPILLHARTHAWQPGATCPAAQRSASHCNNPPQLRWNLHLERAVGPRLNAALDIHNLLDTQPTNYLPGNGGQAVGLDDPLGRYFMLTLQFR